MVAIFILLALLPVSAAAIDCTGQANGHYDVSCKAYVICLNGQAFPVECPYGQVYANSSLGCYDESKVGAPCGQVIDCSNKADGRYSDVDNNCKSYYVCSGGLYYGHHLCPDELVFDQAGQICNWPDPNKPCV